MDQVLTSTAQWTISAHSSGEVLAVCVRRPGLGLGLLGALPGFSASDVEGWLGELAGVADSASRRRPATPGSTPRGFLPKGMHQALTGLLFYQAELWTVRQEPTPCGIALVAEEGKVAFGWVGSGRVELSMDGRPYEPVWILVRDNLGNDARAFLADASHPLTVRATWNSTHGEAGAQGGILEACWPGLAGDESSTGGEAAAAGPAQGNAAETFDWPGARGQVAAPERSTSFEAPAALAPAATSGSPTGSASTGATSSAERPGRRSGLWHFLGWMDRLGGSRGEEGSQVEPSSQAVPALVESPELIAHDVPGVPDLIPAPPEYPGNARSKTTPESIAPAKEPDELTMPGLRVEDLLTSEVSALEPQESVTHIPGLPAAKMATRESSAREPAAREASAAHEVPAPTESSEAPAGPAASVEPEVSAPATEPLGSSALGAEAAPITQPATRVDPFDLAAQPPQLGADSSVIGGGRAGEPEATGVRAAAEPHPAPGPAVVPGPPATAAEAAELREVALEPAVSERLAALSARVARRPEWPEPDEVTAGLAQPFWRWPWVIVGGIVLVLFGAGWLLGRMDLSPGSKGLAAVFRAVGFGPARYEVVVTSKPSGAWISVDGVDQTRRTPATLALKPGPHEIALSISGVGGSSHPVRGKRGERVVLDVELSGMLQVTVPEGGVPITVSVDGMPRGIAPLSVDRLSPGIHRLQFSGPGVAAWEQAVEVQVNRTATVVAQPISSPATGVLEIRAALATETGSSPLPGALVWIDGEMSGETPLKLELPRGPHSIRVRYNDEEAPVQVIDLPGGNQRFATIEFGLNDDRPRLQAALPARIPLDRPMVLSASLDRARMGDVRDMWLHVRTPEGAWRGYAMTVMKAPGGLVGVVAFPTTLFDAHGRTWWYVSASSPMGDEYFTELQRAQSATRP